jgi:hypothetical protein
VCVCVYIHAVVVVVRDSHFGRCCIEHSNLVHNLSVLSCYFVGLDCVPICNCASFVVVFIGVEWNPSQYSTTSTKGGGGGENKSRTSRGRSSIRGGGSRAITTPDDIPVDKIREPTNVLNSRDDDVHVDKEDGVVVENEDDELKNSSTVDTRCQPPKEYIVCQQSTTFDSGMTHSDTSSCDPLITTTKTMTTTATMDKTKISVTTGSNRRSRSRLPTENTEGSSLYTKNNDSNNDDDNDDDDDDHDGDRSQSSSLQSTLGGGGAGGGDDEEEEDEDEEYGTAAGHYVHSFDDSNESNSISTAGTGNSTIASNPFIRTLNNTIDSMMGFGQRYSTSTINRPSME